MTLPTLNLDPGITEERMRVLAREIAMDIYTVEEILQFTGTTSPEFERIKETPFFNRLLSSELEAWNGALNANERVKVKAAAAVEHFLPELHTRVLDPQENLNAKVEAAKFVAKLAGMGMDRVNVNDAGGDRFSVTINMGTDKQVKIAKDITPPVLEHNE
jgi:hypothetical protein